MGTQVIVGYLCLLILNKAVAKSVNAAHLDNVGSESVPRLYNDRSLGVYASATPYAAYSYHVPTFVVPKSNVIPVKQESVAVQNVNGYLRDSYGQRFVQAPQTLSYKSTYPEQYVQLQNLPVHLSQPLVATAPHIHYTPQIFGQRLTNFQNISPKLVNHVGPPQQLIYTNNVRNVVPSSPLNAQFQGYPISQYESPVNNIFTEAQNEPKLQEEQKVSATNNPKNQQQQITPQNNLRLVQAPKENDYRNINNAQKNFVSINSKPLVPLLDLTLLEPLKFANPIIPQVQHYLPRINNIKYEKLPEVDVVKKHEMEFIVQNTKSYDSDSIKLNPKKEVTIKKQKKHNLENVAKHEEEELYETPTATDHDVPKENPELTYEINSPNYKETYTEKKVSYNKQTQSEPVHISYDEQSQGQPKHYSYEKRKEITPNMYNHVHNSKPSTQENKEYNNAQKEAPKQHLQNNEEKIYGHHKPQFPSADSGQSLDANKERERTPEDNEETRNHDENEGSHENYDRPKQQRVNYHLESDDIPPAFNKKHLKPQHSFSQNELQHFQPITPEYEEDIIILPPHQPHGQQHYNDNGNRYSTAQKGNEQPHDGNKSYYFSSPIVVENPKNVNDKETQDTDDDLMDQMIKKMRDNEEDFEKAYKNAAYGFPAYDTPSYDSEKHIYNPNSYGSLNYYKEYDTEKSPLIQYEADGDEFPKVTRSQYKDSRDKTNDAYFDHYVAHKPEIVANKNKKKEEYYQSYVNHRPEYYFANEHNDKKQKAKYTAVPSLNFNTKPQAIQTHSKYRKAPHLEGSDYSKQSARDNSPHATQTFQRYKSKTQFVEPQYQYGFEPVSIPQLLDSEMAVMASIISPKNDKPGMRKKDFVDNNSWLVKKHITKTKAAS